MECLLDALANLLRKALLHLQTVRENVNNTGYLAESGDVSVGDVSHVCLAIERQHVMLAKREEVDVLHHHHLIVVFLEERVRQYRFDARSSRPSLYSGLSIFIFLSFEFYIRLLRGLICYVYFSADDARLSISEFLHLHEYAVGLLI